MKNVASKSAPVVAVLTAAMLAENESSRQTMWVALGSTALRFRKLYVPGVERGSIFGLFRTVEGKAFLVVASKTTPTLDGDKLAHCEKTVDVNGRRFDAYVTLDAAEQEGALCAILLDEEKRCYRVVRATAYDNLGYIAD